MNERGNYGDHRQGSGWGAVILPLGLAAVIVGWGLRDQMKEAAAERASGRVRGDVRRPREAGR